MTDTIQLKKELKPAFFRNGMRPLSAPDNAAFGAAYKKGAVRIYHVRTSLLPCFGWRGISAVFRVETCPGPMRGFFYAAWICSSNGHAPPREGDLAGEIWDTSGRDCLWSDSDQPSKATYIAPRGRTRRRTRTSPPCHPPASQVLTCGAIAQLDDVALRSALGELRSL